MRPSHRRQRVGGGNRQWHGSVRYWKVGGGAVPVMLKVGGGFKCGSEIEGSSEWFARPGGCGFAGRCRAGRACSSGRMAAEFECETIGGNPGLGGAGRR